MKPDYEKRYTMKPEEYAALRSTLSCWYGNKRSDLELGTRSVPTFDFVDVANGIMRSIATPDTADTMLIAENFSGIMGEPLCRCTKFNSFKANIAYIEVNHPAWLRELSGPLKIKFKEKINALLGSKRCFDIVFIPSGR